MTVSYNSAVSSVSFLSFFRLLLRWRGSIWKSISGELLLWIAGYYAVFAFYRFGLREKAQRKFEQIAEFCDDRLIYIPLTFMLGFFVSVIVDRWRRTFDNMGWIENLALTVTNLLRGDDKEVVQMRRDIIRYTVLSQVDGHLYSCKPSPGIDYEVQNCSEGQFKQLHYKPNASFLNEDEMRNLEEIKLLYNKYWAPLHWALSICVKALNKEYFETPFAMICVQNEIKAFRTNLALLCNFDWVPVPIAYPQVVFLAVRVYFTICLVSRQYLLKDENKDQHDVDLYVPFMTILEFIFLVGWMKVAEALLNPLGEDDDDFECNFLIDKNIATGLCIVDDEYGSCPGLTSDKIPNCTIENEMGAVESHPYTLNGEYNDLVEHDRPVGGFKGTGDQLTKGRHEVQLANNESQCLKDGLSLSSNSSECDIESCFDYAKKC